MLRFIAIIFFALISSASAQFNAGFQQFQTAQLVQTISSVQPTTFEYITGSSSGTTVGTATVTMSPSFLNFSGTFSLSGTNASEFSINSSTGVITTNGSTPTCSSPTAINNINVVATQITAYGNPFTQAITITCELTDTPAVITYMGTSPSPNADGGDAGNNYKMYLPPTGAGDTVFLGITGASGKTVTLTDSSGDTMPSAFCSADNGAGNNISFGYIIQPTAGTTWIEAAWSGGTFNPFDFAILELNNIGSASAQGFNCQAGLTATAGTVTPTAFTPTNNDSTGGNVIVSYTPLAESPNCNATKYTPATGFTLLGDNEASVINGNGYGIQTSTQYEIQTTHASTVPTMAMTGETCSSGNGDTFNVISVALMIGPAGITTPTTIHVAKIIQMTTDNFGGPANPSTFTIDTPTLGNLRVFQTDTANTGAWMYSATSLTSSDSCNYTKVTDATSGLVTWYAQNCSPCPTCTATFHGLTGSLANTAGQFYDIENANTSSFQNEGGNNLTCAAGSPGSSNNPAFTPSNSAGVAIGVNAIGNGPGGVMTSPSGAINLNPTFSSQTDGEFLAFGDWHAMFYYSSNAVQDWDWTIAGPGNTCTTMVAAFE